MSEKAQDGKRAAACPSASNDAPTAAVAAIVGAELIRQAAVLTQPDGDDFSPSRVHKMRVATRRARAALKTFKDELPEQSRRLQQELKWLAGALGAVRDLDVYAERYRRRRTDMSETDAEALARYESHLAEAHETARADVTTALASKRFRELLAVLEAVSQMLSATTHVADAADVREVGLGYASRARKQIIKRGRRIDDDSPAAELHELRKKIKAYRYLLESIEPYTDDVRPLRKAAVRLQTVLGEHQDACTAEARVAEHSEAAPWDSASPKEHFTLGRLAEAERRAAAKARRRFEAAWEDFEECASELS